MRLNRIRIPRAIRRHVLVLSGKGTNLNLRGAIVPSLLGATCGNCFRFKLSHGQKSRYSASFGSTKAIFRSKKFQQTEYIDFFIGYALARFRLEVESLPPQAAAKNTALLIAHRLPRRMGSPRHEREFLIKYKFFFSEKIMFQQRDKDVRCLATSNLCWSMCWIGWSCYIHQ